VRDFKGRGFKIHYVEQGSGDAVVFAHGFVMDHTMFAAQFEDLPHMYRCIAWDMRGHGASACPPGPWSLQDIVEDLAAFIDGVDAAPCHLAGMSIGGMAAVRVALQHPELVRSLILIDTSADTEDTDKIPQYQAFASVIEADGLQDDLVDATLPLFYADKYRASEPDAIAIHADRSKHMAREALVEGIRALVGRDSVVDGLGDIRVPVLVIHGEDDIAIPMAQAEALASGIAGASLVRVPEAGHTTPMEAPDAVNQAIGTFLGRYA
jgi:pimeloyl-ACP methyl ester carboxylesterase